MQNSEPFRQSETPNCKPKDIYVGIQNLRVTQPFIGVNQMV